MRRERMFLDAKSDDMISYALYLQGSSNRPEIERMKRILKRAVKHELSDRQRDCLTMYYLEGMKEKDIASKMNLSKSTVSRHLKAATLKLRKVASYYER